MGAASYKTYKLLIVLSAFFWILSIPCLLGSAMVLGGILFGIAFVLFIIGKFGAWYHYQ